MIRNILSRLTVLILLSLFPLNAWAVDYTSDANCQAAWLFTEGSGATVADSSANSNTGNFKSDGEPAWASISGTGAPSYADYMVSFDGSDDYIDFGTGVDQTTNDFSCVLWAQYFTPWTGTYFSNRKTSSPYSGYLFYNTSSKYNIQLNDQSNFHVYAGTNTISGDVWHHLAIVVDRGNDVMDLYVDGVLDTNDVDISAVSGSITSTNTTWMGRDEVSGLPFNDGDFTESAFFGDVVTITEINDIMDNGLKPAVGAAYAMQPIVNIF